MKVIFKQLGALQDAPIELKDLTLFCGANNTGKTYAMYAIYGLLDFKFDVQFDFVKTIAKNLIKEGVCTLSLETIIENHFDEIVVNIEKDFLSRLPRLFSTEADKFKQAEIKLYFDKTKVLIKALEKQQAQRIQLGKEEELIFEITKFKNEDIVNITLIDNKLPAHIISEEISKFILRLLLSNDLKKAFLLPAERSGLNLFYRELGSKRTAKLHPNKLLLLQSFLQNGINPEELFRDIMPSRYPEPVADYIDFLNDIETLKKNKSDYHELAVFLQKQVINGVYSLDKDGEIYFKPYKSKERLNLHLSSSTVKNLFGLWFYLEYVAQKDDCLMIDEPELNLHPDNQRKLARLLAQLVNSDLKIIVSTHSDYFVRELNNLIMLNKGFNGAKELQTKYGYQDNELLDIEKVIAYLFDNKKVEPMEFDSEEGIIAKTFDNVINKLNNSSNEIYYTMQDAKGAIE
jgi:ABC-type uncharacterized transport system ATPase subunit